MKAKIMKKLQMPSTNFKIEEYLFFDIKGHNKISHKKLRDCDSAVP